MSDVGASVGHAVEVLGPERYASAILNVLEDATAEAARSEDAFTATLNILSDLDAERSAAQDLQLAMLNVLTDFADERDLLETTQRGMVNILEDFEAEKELVERANRDLAATTAELERANEELESFSYSVAHDLRAPLRAIDGFSRILQEDYSAHFDSEGQRVFGVVIENVAKMGRLIDDLLTFSRLSRTPLEVAQVDMSELVRLVFHELQRGEPDRKITLDIGDLGVAWCDIATIRQAWVNLCSNAMKFTRDQPVARIKVRADRNDGEIVYSIRDNGAGFDMAYADKLFGVFQRLHSTREFEGTGIGLAIVRRVIERHGGRVSAEGAVSQGATFTLSLPNQGESE